ncbi:MAG TPA: molybdenum ABC transporter ATP-binding protein [Thermoanaerobaculia bacterium]|jgi:molybdate transport system ATP-binding protein|nr:molybdenum ABC transporter ATP-binding protein [Thermoanaerobaculia bacterium]
MLRVDVQLELSSFPLEVAVLADRRVTGIFGPSGAGKTSLLEVVIGLRRDARGSVEAFGSTWLDSAGSIFVPPEERGIGYVPQEGLLFPHLDVRGNLLAGARSRARRVAGADAAELTRVCALLEIDTLLDRPVSTLSAGQRQRVALARAVCSRPRLLVLDEPLASLELPLRRRILPFLRRLRDELDLPILYVSHEPLEIQALADEVIVLRQGRVVAQGPPARVLADPEVFALSPDEEYENVLAAVAGEAEDGEGRAVELAPGVRLRVPAFAGATGSTVLVSIPAQQVLLAVESPRSLSAQNVLPAVVRDVRPAGALRLVASELRPGGAELVAEVTPRACVDLDLRAGREVFMIVKQTGCRVYAPSSDAPSSAPMS